MLKKTGKHRTRLRTESDNTYCRFHTLLGVVMVTILTLISPLYAADLQFTASLDRNDIGINQTCVYNLNVSGEDTNNLPQIQAPSFEGFSVVNRSQSTQIQFINGRSSQARTFSFILAPQKQGPLTIGSARFEFSGKTYATEPVTVKVGAAVAQPAPQAAPQRRSIESMFGFSDDEAFTAGDTRVDMQIGKRSLYVGEKTVLSFQLFYQRGFFGQPQYVPPKVTNFIIKNIDKAPVSGQRTINGKNYQYQTIRQTASPINAGASIIPAASLVYASSPFGGSQRLDTKPIEVQVKKLPDNAPEEFSGAVGNFNWQISCDKTKTTSGAGYVLKININGIGNLDPVTSIGLEKTSSTFFYLNKAQGTETIKGDSVAATKYLEYFIVPQKTGILTIPELRFCYFDPRTNAYRTLTHTVPPIQVTTVSDVSSTTLPSSRSGSLSLNDSNVEIIIKKSSFNTIVHGIWIILISSMLIGCCLGVIKIVRSLALFEKRSLQKEYDHLRTLSGAELSLAAQKYLYKVCHRRYGITMKGLSSQMIKDRLLKKKLDGSMIKVILDSQADLDALRFSPATDTALKEHLLSLLLQLR